MEVKQDNIPQKLRQEDRWLLWQYQTRQDASGTKQKTKVPVDGSTGHNADPTDSATWTTYADAARQLSAADGFDGLGFALGDGWAGVDLDDCRDPETGDIAKSAQAIIDQLDSYTEVSPSGCGLKIFCKGGPGDADGHRRDMPWDGQVEIYWANRYFTVTGHVSDGMPKHVREADGRLKQLHERLWPRDDEPAAQNRDPAGASSPPTTGVNCTDEQLLNTAFNASNGSRIRRLFNGDWQGLYQSQSEADLALCSHLAFYTRGNRARMDRIFRKSGLVRDKWTEREDYRERTINTALAGRTEFYTPPTDSLNGPQQGGHEEGRRPVTENGGGDDASAPKGDDDDDDDDDDDNQPATADHQPSAAGDGDDAGVNIAKEAPEAIVRFGRHDTGNARLTTEMFGDQIRYDMDRERLFVYDDGYWQGDEGAEHTIRPLIVQAAEKREEAVDAIHSRADNNQPTPISTDEADRHFSWARRSRNNRRIKDCLACLPDLKRLQVNADLWDADPMLLGVPNGVVNLENAQLRPSRRDDYITMLTSCEYDPEADCPRWRQFLREVFPGPDGDGNAELINYLQVAVGYSLTGHHNIEQCWWLLYGRGGNGKTVFLETLNAVFGAYGMSTQMSAFEYTRSDGLTPELAQIGRARFATAAEAGETSRLDKSVLKGWTGGRKFTVQDKYKTPETIVPRAKLWLSVNERPTAVDAKHAFWRRLHIIPFTREFSEDEIDRGLTDDLINTEAAGILRWAVEGAARWAAEQLQTPESVRAAVQKAKHHADPLAEFISARCIVDDDARVRGGNLYEAYKQWCAKEGIGENDDERLTRTRFGTHMGDKFDKGRDSDNYVQYHGIGLLDTGDPDG